MKSQKVKIRFDRHSGFNFLWMPDPSLPRTPDPSLPRTPDQVRGRL